MLLWLNVAIIFFYLFDCSGPGSQKIHKNQNPKVGQDNSKQLVAIFDRPNVARALIHTLLLLTKGTLL